MKILFTIILSAFALAACSQETAIENMTVAELNAVEFNNDDSKVVLDVRTPSEYAEGRIIGSENLDVLKTDLFTTSIEKLDKSKTYYVICKSGRRSMKAANQMKKAGFEHVINITEGMDGWKAAKYATEK